MPEIQRIKIKRRLWMTKVAQVLAPLSHKPSGQEKPNNQGNSGNE